MGTVVEVVVFFSLCVLIAVDLVIQFVLKRRLAFAGTRGFRTRIATLTPAKGEPNPIPAVRRNARELEVGSLRRIMQVVISEASREEVLRETVNVVSELTDREWVAVLLHREAQGELEVLAEREGALGRPGVRVSAAAGIFAEAIGARAARTISGREAEAALPEELSAGRILRTLTVLPAVVRERVVCVLVLADRRELPPLTPDEERTAVGFADLAGMAIEHDRLSGELGRKVRELSTLYEVAGYEMATITSSSPGIDDCLERTLDLVYRLLRVDACSVMLLDEKAQELYVHAGRDHGPKPAQTLRLRIGQGIAGRAAAEGVPVVAENLEQDRRFVPQPGAAPAGSTLLAVPMIAQNRVVGVINVRSMTARRFTDDEVRTLQLIAGRTALSVDNARYRETLESERRKFQGIVETAADGIVLIDRSGHVVHANGAAEQLVGAAAGALVGRTWGRFCRLRTRTGTRLIDKSAPFSHMVDVEGKNRAVELELTGADGNPRWIEARCGVVRDGAGEPALGVACLRDVTEERAGELERERRIREAVEEARLPLVNAAATLQAMAGERMGPLNFEQKKGLSTSILNLRKVLVCRGVVAREAVSRSADPIAS